MDTWRLNIGRGACRTSGPQASHQSRGAGCPLCSPLCSSSIFLVHFVLIVACHLEKECINGEFRGNGLFEEITAISTRALFYKWNIELRLFSFVASSFQLQILCRYVISLMRSCFIPFLVEGYDYYLLLLTVRLSLFVIIIFSKCAVFFLIFI